MILAEFLGQVRYYNPVIARFISEDTYQGNSRDPLSLNLYTYCKGNPVNYCDPSGNWQESDRYLPDWAQSLLVTDTKQWTNAKAKNDTAKMSQAHEHAEAIRQFAARKSTYNMMQFFGVSDPTKIQLPNNAMVFMENTRCASVGPVAVVEGHTIVMDFDKYCEYVFVGISYGPSGIRLGDIDVTKGYAYNVSSPGDFKGIFFGAGGTYPGYANGGAVGLQGKAGAYTRILQGHSFLGGSAGFSLTYYFQKQKSWVYGNAYINWYSPKSSYNSNNSI